MSELKKIIVPGGMLQAAIEDWEPEGVTDRDIEHALENALRWLSENPIRPTDEQNQELLQYWVKMQGKVEYDSEGRVAYPRMIAMRWQEMMFLAAEPEIPPQVEVLLWAKDGPVITEQRILSSAHNTSVIEAYRLGKQAGLDLGYPPRADTK